MAWIRGTKPGTHANIPDRMQSSHIRRALVGAVSLAWSRHDGDTSAATMAAALSRRFALFVHGGGVLEHPAYSDAWNAFLLPIPTPGMGWQRGMCGGWSCHVEQGRYGHPAKKATWLYAFNVGEPPSLDWLRLKFRAELRKLEAHAEELGESTTFKIALSMRMSGQR